jgi:thiamine biosynthesis lipoprotein
MKEHSCDTRLSRRSAIFSIASLLFLSPVRKALAGAPSAARKFDPRFELAIDIELLDQNTLRARSPYVAIWIEDPTGKSIRTLALWVETTRKGPKYIPDLRRWFRDAQSPIAATGGDLIQTVSSATRNPGKYQVVWDGKSDTGELVDQGEYTLFIEVDRQHGTYQLITQDMKIGTHPFKDSYQANTELAGGNIEFRKRS